MQQQKQQEAYQMRRWQRSRRRQRAFTMLRRQLLEHSKLLSKKNKHKNEV